jgi:proliferating cell nuclear antigen PCNA
MGKIVDITTVDAIPFKTLIEGLKDLLSDTNLEIIRSDIEGDNKEETDQTETNDSKDGEDDSKKIIIDKKKTKATKKPAAAAADKKKPVKKDKGDQTEEETKDSDEKDEKSTQIVKKDGDTGGIKIVATDNTRSLLISVKLESKAFHRFYSKKKTFDMPVNLLQYYKLIKSLEKDDTLNMYVNDDDKQTLVIKIVNSEKKYETVYKLKLLDINKTQINVPAINCESVIKFDTSEFHKICREMNTIAEHIEIKCTRKSITFSCKGDCAERSTTYYTDINSVNINFAKNAPEVVQGIFELKYLVMFSKYSNLCQHIQIYMKNDWPLCIKYTVATLGKMILCLAPIKEDAVKQNFEDEDNDYDEVDIKYKNDD